MQPETVEQILTDNPVEEPMADDSAQAAQTAVSAAEDVTARLAGDFLALCEEFPHLSSPSQLPETVLETAARQGIPLLDAFLRYRWQEEKKIADAAAKRQQAAARSAGSLSRGSAETPPEQDAFLRAFRAAL